MERGQLYQQWDVYMAIARDLSTEQIQEAKERELKKLLELLLDVLPQFSDQLHQLIDIHSVSNVLMHEFMSDVRNIGSENATENFPALVDYLSHDRGAVMVIVLAIVGIRDLVHGLSFGKCLISILRQFIRLNSCSWPKMQREVRPTELEAFIVREPRCRKHPAKDLENTLEPTNEQENCEISDLELGSLQKTNTVKLPNCRKASARLRKQQNEGKDKDNSDSDTSRKLLVVFREMRRTFRNVPNLVENLITGSTFYSLGSQLLKSSAATDILPKVELESSELCLLLASILKDVCFDDDQYREEKSTCMQLLPVFEELLNDLVDQMYKVHCDYSKDAVSVSSLGVIGRCLMRIFTVLTSKISSQIDGLLILRNGRTPKSILERLCDRVNNEISLAIASSERFLLFFDIVNGCLLYAETVLSCVSLTPLRLTSALDAIEFVLHENGLELLEIVLLQLDEELSEEQSILPAEQLLSTVLQSIGRIIGLLKLLRARYIHLLTCTKRLHRQCSAFTTYAHHHDVLGLPSAVLFDGGGSKYVTGDSHTCFNNSNSDLCAIAAINLSLISVFAKSSEVTKHQILNTLTNHGLCCCIPVEFFARSFLNHFMMRSVGLCQHVLNVVTTAFVSEFGGAIRKTDDSSSKIWCTTCTEEFGDVTATHLQAFPSKMETSDSALSDSDSQGGVGLVSSRWSCLKLLIPYLCSTDDVIAHYTRKQVLQLVDNSSALLRYELLYFLFLPALQEAERIFLPPTPEDDPPTEAHSPLMLKNLNTTMVQYCLHILPKLLSIPNSCELFISSNGVGLLENLVSVDSFQINVLHVLRKLACIQDWWPVPEESMPSSNMPGANCPHVECEKGKNSCQNAKCESVVTASLATLIKLLFIDLCGSTTLSKHFVTSRLGKLSDLWSTVRLLFVSHKLFQQMFVENGGPAMVHSLLFFCVSQFLQLDIPMVTLQFQLDVMNDDGTVAEKYGEVRRWFLLLRASLTISLFCARQGISFGLQNLTVDDLLENMIQAVVEETKLGNASDNSLQLFCEVLLICINDKCLDNMEKLSYQYLHFMENDSSESIACRLVGKEQLSACAVDDGYDADSEMSSDSNCDNQNISDESVTFLTPIAQFLVGIYPELSRLVLHVAINYQNLSCHHKLSDNTRSLNNSKTSNETVLQTAITTDDVVSSASAQLDSFYSQNLNDEKCTELPSTDQSESFVSTTSEKQEMHFSLHLLKRLASFGKTSVPLIIYIHKQDLMESFISCYLKNRASNEGINQDFLKILMGLVLRVAQFGLSPKSLSAVLSLFNEGENLTLLLSTLNVLTLYLPVQPKYSLRMPITGTSAVADDLGLSSASVLMQSMSMEVCPSRCEFSRDSPQMTLSLSSSGLPVLQNSMDSTEGSIVRAALRMALRELATPFGRKGGKLSVACWIMMEGSQVINQIAKRKKFHTDGLKLNKRNLQNSNEISEKRIDSHIISLGGPELMLEVWLKSNKMGLSIRLTSHLTEVERIVLCEASLSVGIQKGKWHHLTFTFEQGSCDSNRASATITTCLDGISENSVLLKWAVKEMPSPKNTPASCCYIYLGHCTTDSNSDKTNVYYQIGNFFVFQDLLLTKWMSFYLFCLGPDCSTLSKCDSSELNPMFIQQVSLMLRNEGKSSQDLEAASLMEMRGCLLLTYSPRDPKIFCFAKDPSPEAKLSRQGSVKRSVRMSSSLQMNDLCSQLFCVRPRVTADLNSLVNQETTSSIRQLGGIGAFIYLFAKVVECSLQEVEQAQALHLVFNLVQKDQILMQEFIEMDGYAMIVKVFLTVRCVIGYKMLKVLLNACVTSPLMSYDRVSQSYILNGDNESLIRDVHIIVDIVFMWTVWNKAADDVWLLGFKAIESLIAKSHNKRDFNIRALLMAGVVEKLFNICLERLQLSYPSLSSPLCEVFLSIISKLISLHPDIHHIIQICDFLLLTHPAANTFVFHNPTTFCFRNKWIAGERPTALSYESSKVIVSGSLDDTKSRSSLSFSLSAEGEEKLEPLSSNPSGLNRRRRISDIEMAGSLVFKKDLKASDAKTPRSKTPDSIVSNSTVADVISNGRIAGSVVIHNASDSVKGSNYQGSAARTVSQPSDDVYLIDNCVKDYFHDSTDPCVFATPVSDSEPVEVRPSISRVSSSAAFPGTDTQGSTVKRLSGTQDCDDYTEVFQREVVCGSISPATASCAEEELSLPLDDQTEGIDRISGSEDLDSNAVMQDERDSSDGNPKEADDGVEDADVMGCGTRSLDSVEKDDEGLVSIVTGLLVILADLLPDLKTTDLERIFSIVLKPHVLVIMAHHGSAQIRVAVLKLLRCYLKLTTAQQKDSFIRLHIFHLLANQLHQHDTSQSIVEECLSILVGQSVQLDQFSGVDLPLGIPVLCQSSVNLLLAVAENCVPDAVLCHHLFTALQKVFVSLLDVSQVMLENGLAEVLCNVIHRFGICWEKDSADGVVTSGAAKDRQIIMNDIQTFFSYIAQKAFCTTGSSSYQQFEETFTLLKCLETRLQSLHGREASVVSFITSIQCEYLETIFENILKNPNSSQESSFSFGTIQSTVESFFSKLSLPKCFSNFPRLSVSNENLSVPCKEEKPKPEKQRFSFSFASSAHPSVSNDGQQGSENSLTDSGHHFLGFSFPPLIGSSKDVAEAPTLSHANKCLSDTSGSNSLRKIFAFGNFDVSISPSELTERFKKLVCVATDFVLFRGNQLERPSSQASSSESDKNGECSELTSKEDSCCGDSNTTCSPTELFERHLLEFMLQAIDCAMKKGRKTVVTSLMSQIKDVLRLHLSRLLVYLLSPSAGLRQNMFAIETVNLNSSSVDVLSLLITVNDAGLKLSYYIYDLVTFNVKLLSHSQRNEINDFLERLESNDVAVVRIGANLTPADRAVMKKEMEEWSKRMIMDRRDWLKKEGLAFQRGLHRLDGLSKKLSSQAMEVTQVVNNDQNRLRKKFILHAKCQMSDRLQVKKNWQELIAQLSHERGVWHNSKSYPRCWQLDPTEGPSRQRCKLRQCHLNVEPRFLVPEQQWKLDARKHEPPLNYLFQDDKLSLDSAAVIYKLHTNENIEYTCMCRNVTPQTTTSGVLLVGQRVVYYVADEAVMDDNYTQALLGNCDDLFMTLPHDDILEFHKQWYLLKDEALEIFLSNGKTCLLALNSTQDRDELFAKLTILDLPNAQLEDNLYHTQVKWLEGRMTNFEYLMNLNKMAGRSFNDLMQYPVFPFILSQYSESTLDLERPSSYRDLSKTISTQYKEQENKYIQLYQVLLEQKPDSNASSDGADILLEPYHYTNHYSNVATVLQFLVRLPPFTQLFIEFQDRNFDCADRTFHNIQTSYNLVTKMSMTDSKELIPEFFYLPEFLENLEGFNFGTKQNGELINNVVLPPWCRNDARLFTLIQRQALESEYVTRTLASWIDLVFGYKQRGKEAVEAVNVFRPSMYFGIDVDAIEDELARKAVKTMIRTHGQTPKQLFKNPHPPPPIKPRPAPIKDKPSPLKQISGLRWGDYVGSPDCPNPTIISCEEWKVDVTSLVVLPTGQVFGLGRNSGLLVKQKGMKLMPPVGLTWAAILSWHHRDGIIRLKNDHKQPSVNFLHWNTANQVTCCASHTNCCQIFLGTELGNIVVLNTKLNSFKPSNLQVFDHRLQLFGHRAGISHLSICQPFSILVSASQDCTCIIWDLNRMSYVRSITDHKSSVTSLCVSNSSGDIASVSNRGDEGGSCLMIHTVNARLIASIVCSDRIQCIAYSPGPEGQSVNVIAGGLDTGKIRLWSSWDLSAVRDLVPSKFLSPVLSLAYSYDGQNLFCLSQGLLTVWGNKPSNKPRKFNFIPFL